MKTILAALSTFAVFLLAAGSYKTVFKHDNKILPPGIIVLEEPIILKSGDKLIGAEQGTTLFVKDGGNFPAVIVGDIADEPQFETKNVLISNLTIDGNREKQTVEIWKDSHIRNNGISVRRASDIKIENVTVKRARSGGIVLERGSRRISVDNCVLEDNEWDGLAAYQTEECLLTNLKIVNNNAAAASFDLEFNNNLAANWEMKGNKRHGIFMRFSKGNRFENMCIHDGESGVFLAESELPNSAAKNNIFNNFSFYNTRPFLINDQSCSGNIFSLFSKPVLVSESGK